MQAENPDLHGNVPDKSDAALILIDVINDLEFDGGELLLEHALPMAERLAALKQRASSAGIPSIYVNDNFGRWRSDFNTLIAHCLEDGVRGRPVVELLQPGPDDYFVLKPTHSGFYGTALDLLLNYLNAHTLVLTGVAGNICVLFTANDAFVRDYRLYVPEDCVASNYEKDNRIALDQMRTVLRADIRPSTVLDIRSLNGPTQEADGLAAGQMAVATAAKERH
jgi:nicotinamidase-related amidase